MPMSTRAVRGAVLCLSLWSLSAGAVEVHSDRTDHRVLPTLRVVADEHEATPALRLDACTLSGASATMQGANYDALTIGVFADGFDP